MKVEGTGRSSMYKGHTTVAVVMIAIVAASGGLLFGYDNGITGGVITMRNFQESFFPQDINAHPESKNGYCKFDDQLLQLFTSSLFLAGAVAAMVGMFTSKKFGRRFTMICGGAFFIVGTALVASAFQLAQLVIGRIILGFGVGFATQATPLYLSEMAPYNLRGALNILFQLAVTIGIFVAQLINYGTQNIYPWGWRLSLALAGIPGLMLFVGALCLPDTPNSLIERGKLAEGERVLQRIRGTSDVTIELEDIVDAVNVSRTVVNPWGTIFRRRYWPQLVISILIPTFQQWVGINAIIFYAPQLFQTTGAGSDAALLNTVIIGAVNVASTVVAILVVDRFGRKFLLIEGGIQLVACEFVVGALIASSLGTSGTGYTSPSVAQATIAFVCIYIAGFAWSWGPLGWLVPSEIQPLETRAAGTAINTFVNLLMTFVVGQTFLSMLCAMKFGVFFFFGGIGCIAILFAIFFIPETKNVPIEEIEETVVHKHWFWSRIVRGTKPPTDVRRSASSIIQVSTIGGKRTLSMVDRSNVSVDQLEKIEHGVVGNSYTKPTSGYTGPAAGYPQPAVAGHAQRDVMPQRDLRGAIGE
jgi:sugar porter (SP) family MFS transporter